MMTKVETVCTFECPASGIDIVQMGGVRTTAHHHIQTSEGWMTARASPQAVPTQILASTMGCRFEPAIDPLHKGLLTYPDTVRVRLGQIRGIELGRKYFKANEVETLQNGELHFNIIPTKKIDPPISDEERPGTTLRPSMHDTTTLHLSIYMLCCGF